MGNHDRAESYSEAESEPLSQFEAPVRKWFTAVFDAPTAAQTQGWPAIAAGDSTLILAPTGSGKTLAAFLWCLNRLMFAPVPAERERCRVLYVSPLKALAVDVERNLRAPLVGISQAAAALQASRSTCPIIGIRTGRHAAERARAVSAPSARHPHHDAGVALPAADVERARGPGARSKRVIIDEIHALVPTKRGAHLALSLERLEATPRRAHCSASASRRRSGRSTRWRGFSAASTSRRRARAPARPREEATADAGTRRRRERAARDPRRVRREPAAAHTPRASVRSPSSTPASAARSSSPVEVPVEDMSRIGQVIEVASGPASATPRTSIWTAIHPRLVELIRAHTSTLIFVNSRRLAERLAGAINELAGETIARSHHGSLAREQRMEIEDRLKAGSLPALIATSSLELGIDMGAIDLVIQIEAPSSVSSGLQRIGRAGHRIDAVSEGVIIPKFRGDLLASAAVAKLMHEGQGRSDALSAQSARRARAADRRDGGDGRSARSTSCSTLVRRAAPFESLSRSAFDGVLDMLSGRYPSDEFAELRPRVTWNRATGALQHAQRREAPRDRQRRHDSRSRALRRLPRRQSAGTASASASSTRRWCSRPSPARCSCSAPRAGASKRSRTIACSSRRRRASRARCRSGKATAPAARSSSAWRSAR